jgi:class 3 adenylate cyclase
MRSGSPMGELPSGTVTFLFTDVEGSTKLLHELGAGAYDAALLEHRRVLREVFASHGGVEVDTQGDAFFYAFPDAAEALTAAGQGQQALSDGPISVRMGLHTGTPHVGREGYVGDDVHLGARIAASAHGGQVIVSAATAELVALELTDLGEHRLKGHPRGSLDPSARRRRLPTAEDDLEYEPAAPGVLLRWQGARNRGSRLPAQEWLSP